jgi:hypothetical protein
VTKTSATLSSSPSLAEEEQDEGVDTVQPKILSETFPSAREGEELNVADVLVTCNFSHAIDGPGRFAVRRTPRRIVVVGDHEQEGEELNVADVLVTCNFLFRDA